MRLDVDARVATAAHQAALDLAIEKHEATAARALDRIVRRYVRQAIARFTRGEFTAAPTLAELFDRPGLATFAGEFERPSWRIPIPVDLLDEAAMEQELEARARAYSDDVARTTTTSVAASLGIDFDQSNRLLTGVIAGQAGSRITTAPKDLVKVMMGSLQESYDEGDSIPKAARKMRAAGYAHSKSYAVRIARTELIGAVNAASLAQVQGATTIPFKLWMATGDNRTRPTHKAADGQTVPIDSTFVVGTARLEYPGDGRGPGEEVIMCRCTLGYTDEPRPGAGRSQPSGTTSSPPSGLAGVQAAVDAAVRHTIPNRPVDYKLVELADDDMATARSLRDGNIAVHASSDHKTNVNAVTHEVGHLVDRSILGVEDSWFSESAAGANIIKMLRETPTMKAIRNDEVKILEGDTQTRNYFLSGREAFARAFHQHAAIVSKDPDLMREIRHLQSDDFLSFQVWQDDEFAPISAALRELFEAVTASAAGTLRPDQGGAIMAVAVEDEQETTPTGGSAWSGVIAQEGVDTGDGRRIAEGALNWREPPLTLMAQHTTPDFGGHAEAAVAGRIDSLDRDGANIVASGVFDTGEWGSETERMVRDGALKGVSIDLAINDAEIIPAENPKDEIEAALGGTLNVLDGTVLGATVVPFPAFENAQIALVAGGAMRLGSFRRDETGQYRVSFYMPFAPLPSSGDDTTPEEDNEDVNDNPDAKAAISEITDAVNGYPGLDGKVVITIDGEDTTVAFPSEAAEEAPE